MLGKVYKAYFLIDYMANIVKCGKCGGKRFVPDIGDSIPMDKYKKGLTFIDFEKNDSCTCKK